MSGLHLSIGEATLASYLLALARTAGFVLLAPPFNSRGIPTQGRAAVALALALPLSAWMTPVTPALGSGAMLLRVVVQMLTGATLGALVMIAVATIQSVGELVDVIGGFTVSQALDPLLMVQSSVMGRLHQLAAVTLIFVGDGHLMILHGLSRSIQLMPGPELNWQNVAQALAADVAGMMLAAVQIAAPIAGALLIADVALGLLTRAAPALNAFALAFPLKILLSVLVVGLVLTQLPGSLHTLVEDAVGNVVRLSTGGASAGGR